MFVARMASVAALTLLVASSAIGQPAGDTSAAAPPARILVQVWSFGFAPHPIRLAAGRPVTVTFLNQSGSSHDFTAPAFFAAARITDGAAPDGEIELKPHATVSITLVPAAGAYEAHCSHFLHKQMGMSDQILVD